MLFGGILIASAMVTMAIFAFVKSLVLFANDKNLLAVKYSGIALLLMIVSTILIDLMAP